MKIAFFGTKEYDRAHFRENYKGTTILNGISITFLRPRLSLETAVMADGYEAVCAFVNDDLSAPVIHALADRGIKYILMRCAGYNNVDLSAAKERSILVARVPAYSPEAVAEHAFALLLAANRRIHKAYNKVRDNDYSLVGLTGVNLYEKTAGIIGTGKIGRAFIRICRGFGMNVIAWDPYPSKTAADELGFEYLDNPYDVFMEADVISLHCPLTEESYHIINKDTICRMKDGVILLNTSRGGLINTEDLITGIKSGKFHAVGLDVYEEEDGLVFNDKSGEILDHTTTARLLSFPNVILTSHQAFLTHEALEAIADTTVMNALNLANGIDCPNLVTD